MEQQNTVLFKNTVMKSKMQESWSILEEVEDVFRATEAWHYWFLEAREGLHSTINRLGLLDPAEGFTTFYTQGSGRRAVLLMRGLL